MATIDELNARNIRPRTVVRILIYDSTGTDLLLTITEAELIRANVSLRSDLSRINPTLPESEIEIEAYFETDFSDYLAGYGEELEIRYRWWPRGASYGYNRRFYTDERITWKDKILHIHAVDQVHLLDEELPPIYIGQDWYWNYGSISDHRVLLGLGLAFRDFIRGTQDTNNGLLKYVRSDGIGNTGGALVNQDGTFASIPEGGALNILQPRMTRREAIAKMMQLCRWDFSAGELNYLDNFWLTYVDAGMPRIRFEREDLSILQIKKEDCGNFVESREPVLSSITANIEDVNWIGTGEPGADFTTYNKNVRATITKQKGITYEYEGFCDYVPFLGVPDPQTQIDLEVFYGYVRLVSDDHIQRKRPPVDYWDLGDDDSNALINQYGKWLLDEDIATNALASDPGYYTFVDLSGAKWTTAFDPDNPTLSKPSVVWSNWISDNAIKSNTLSVDVRNYSQFYVTTNQRKMTKTSGVYGDGVVLEDEIFLSGHAILWKYDDSGQLNLLPDMGLERILADSNVVGSFTWKGDPRMQPRDYVELVYPDEELLDENGNVLQTENGEDLIINNSKVVTIETITLTHEGGGTIAEYTYREGYC